MKLAVDSVEVATLKPDGRPWDGPGRPRLSEAERAEFFARDLDGQLAWLVERGQAPVPPDVFVRVSTAQRVLRAAVVVETDDKKSFDAEWPAGEAADVVAGAPLCIEVWDRDLVWDDLIGRIEVTVPESAKDGRWEIGAFGQVRRLVLRLG